MYDFYILFHLPLWKGLGRGGVNEFMSRGTRKYFLNPTAF